MKKKKSYIWILDVQGPGTLGGPMGTEHTDHLFDKIFKSEEVAKKWAEKDYESKIEWHKHSSGLQSFDGRYLLYDLRKEELNG